MHNAKTEGRNPRILVSSYVLGLLRQLVKLQLHPIHQATLGLWTKSNAVQKL